MQSPIALRSFVQTQNNQNFVLKSPLRKAAVRRDEEVAAHTRNNAKKLCVGTLFSVLVGMLSSML